MNTPFDKLNRLRKVAGQKELKSWKASGDALDAQINRLEAEGYTDPGPDPIPEKGITPVPEDFIPQVVDFGPDAKADTPPTGKEIPAIAKLIANPDKPQVETKKRPAALARGVGDDLMGAHCRKAVRDIREAERKERKAAKDKEPKKKLSKKERKAAKKARLQKNTDGTSTKTTTAGNKRKIGKELTQKIDKAKKAKKEGKQVDPDNFTVAELARECDMDPKVARAKLRRHEDKIKKLHSKGQDRWSFPNSAKKALRDILSPSK